MGLGGAHRAGVQSGVGWCEGTGTATVPIDQGFYISKVSYSKSAGASLCQVTPLQKSMWVVTHGSAAAVKPRVIWGCRTAYVELHSVLCMPLTCPHENNLPSTD